MSIYTKTSLETVYAQRNANQAPAVIPAPLTGWDRFKAILATQKPTVEGITLNATLLTIILILWLLLASGAGEAFGISLAQLGWYTPADSTTVYTTDTGVFGEGSATIGGGN